MEVQGGEGGVDGKRWAQELWSAYLAYAARNGLVPELSEEGPSKWSFTIADRRAIDLFLSEEGGHCIQRYPSNDRGGRRHTSMAVVMVSALRPVTELTLKESDLQESFQRGKVTAGGQNANKVNSAVRLCHIPSGLEVFINGRDQIRNRATARAALAGKLQDWTRANQTRASYAGAGRGAKVRTYNLIDNRIVDHRNGVKCHKPSLVLDEGRFELLA